MNREEILTLSVSALRAKLGELKLSTHGLKEELQKRLLEHYGLDSTQMNDMKDSVDEDDGSAIGHVVGGNIETSRRDATIASMYTLRDVADSLSNFSGTGTPDVIQWLAEFEEMAAVLQWSPLQMYVYGKQLLVGAAKLFIKSKRGICDWYSLKMELKSEFQVRCSTAEVIRQIRNRRLNKDETLIEYLYSIMEIASRIDLDENSIVEYFIEGIPDSRMNKTVLYQAGNIRELKAQIKVYEKTRCPPQSSYRGKTTTATNSKDYLRKEVKTEGRSCFKCGDKSHIAKDCTKQYKCFKCQGFGHRSFECKVGNAERGAIKVERDQANIVKRGSGLVFKDVTIEGKVLSALIDTGCDICLMRLDALFIFGEVNLVIERVKLSGIGESEINTIGHFDCSVEIDGLKFEATFYVVGEHDILHTVMIGNSLLGKAEVILKEGEATFKMPAEKNYFMDEYKPVVSVDLNHIDEPVKSQVTEVISEYRPECSMKSPVKIDVVLKDNIIPSKDLVDVLEKPEMVLKESDKCDKAIRAVLEYGEYEDHNMQNGVLYEISAKNLVVAPVQLEEEIIRLAYNQGHVDVSKTPELVEKRYCIPRSAVNVLSDMRSCIECDITEAKTSKKECYLNTIYRDERPLVTYQVDQVGPTEARENISQIEKESCKTYKLRRKPETEYELNELVAIYKEVAIRDVLPSGWPNVGYHTDSD